MQKVTFHTLGCKLNFAETSTIGRQFKEKSFIEVPNELEADVVVINTCSVTDRADQKARQTIRHLQKISPNAFVIVTGCYAQLKPDEIAAIPEVDLVLGTQEKFHLFDYVDSFKKNGKAAKIHTTPIDDVHEYGGAFSLEVGNRTRVFLKVQDGCDYNCAYCTIPLARGKSRSPSIESVLYQVNQIADSGVKEVVLSGVNVGDFGNGTSSSLLTLIKQIDQVNGIERVRISSIEPNLLTDDIIDFIHSSQKFCNHFHIPMQSGSDEILKRMKRRYLTSLYQKRIETIYKMNPESGIGADIIVGFPGETDDLFKETLTFTQDLPFTYLHVFTYSMRTNTLAAEMNGQVPHHIRKHRNAQLRVLSQQKEHYFLSGMMGKPLNILVEGDIKDGYQFGYTTNYARIGIPENPLLLNTIQTVKPDSFFSSDSLIGQVIV